MRNIVAFDFQDSPYIGENIESFDKLLWSSTVLSNANLPKKFKPCVEELKDAVENLSRSLNSSTIKSRAHLSVAHGGRDFEHI